LSVLACLNRETGLLVPIAAIIDALYEHDRARLRRGVAALVAGGIVIVLVRSIVGPGEPRITLAAIWQENTSPLGLAKAATYLLLFGGITGWALAAISWARAPIFVRRQAWLVPVYLPGYLVAGIWYEVRLLVPLYPLFIAYALAAVFPAAARERDV